MSYSKALLAFVALVLFARAAAFSCHKEGDICTKASWPCCAGLACQCADAMCGYSVCKPSASLGGAAEQVDGRSGKLPQRSASSKSTGSWSKLVVDGRESDVFVPACAQKGTPMIVSLHAWGTTKELQESTNDKFSFAGYVGPKRCFVVVYPQGQLRVTVAPMGGFTWNAGGCCPRDNSEHVNDVGFLGKVITETASKFNASADLVFAVGVSNGGMMANRLACSDSRIKALVSVAGPLVNGSLDHDLETFTCSRRVPLLHVHGDADPIVPYGGCNTTDGGVICKVLMKILGKSVADVLKPVPEYIADWRIRNGQQLQQPGAITFQNGSTNCTSWGDLTSNVTLCIVHAQGHAWPGHCSILNKVVPGCSCSEAMDASDHALSFLQRYVPSPGLVV